MALKNVMVQDGGQSWGIENGGEAMGLLLEEIKKLREDVKTSQEDTALVVARKARKESYSFKRKANENQYKFNGDVEDRLVEVETLLGSVAADGMPRRCAEAIQKAKEAKGKELIL